MNRMMTPWLISSGAIALGLVLIAFVLVPLPLWNWPSGVAVAVMAGIILAPLFAPRLLAPPSNSDAPRLGSIGSIGVTLWAAFSLASSAFFFGFFAHRLSWALLIASIVVIVAGLAVTRATAEIIQIAAEQTAAISNRQTVNAALADVLALLQDAAAQSRVRKMMDDLRYAPSSHYGARDLDDEVCAAASHVGADGAGLDALERALVARKDGLLRLRSRV